MTLPFNGQPESYNSSVPYDPNAPIEQIASWNYQNALTPWQQFWLEADLDKRCVVGDQRILNNYVQDYQYQKFIFNESLKFRNMVAGHQRRTRKGSKIIPVEGADSKTASQLTSVIQYSFSKDNVYNTVSDGFTGGLDTGLNLLHIYLDYSRDPVSGDIKVDNLEYNTFIMDPWWTKLDLSDCNFIYTRKYLRKEQVIDRLNGHEDFINALPIGEGRGYDLKFTFMPEQFQNYKRNLYAFDEYWYLDDRRAKIMLDTETYESVEVTANEFENEEFQNFLKRHPEVEIVNHIVPTVKLCIMVQGKPVYDGPNPLGIDNYPFVPVVAYHNPSALRYQYRYQGVIRQLRDSQYLYNRWMDLKMQMLESMFNGEHFEEDALIDDNDAFMQGPGKKRFFKKGRMAAYMESPGSRIDGSIFQATADLRDSMMSTSGITEELMGSSDTDVGITQMLRQGAGLTTLQILFDNLDMSQRILTNLAVGIIQQNWTYGKIRRVLGEDPTDEFQSKMFSKYDTQVESSELTSTSQQLAAAQLIELTKMGFPIPPEKIIEKLSIQDKDELIEYLQQQAQSQAEQQQFAAQLQLENQQIVNENLRSSSASEAALAKKRMAQMDTQQLVDMTKIEEAHAERERAQLDRVRAIKELADIDLQQLEKLISILRNIGGDVDSSSIKPTDVVNI